MKGNLTDLLYKAPTWLVGAIVYGVGGACIFMILFWT